jgi:hypothetical protein
MPGTPDRIQHIPIHVKLSPWFNTFFFKLGFC